MLYYENQLNLGNIYQECVGIFSEQRTEFLNLMKQYLYIDKYIFPMISKKLFTLILADLEDVPCMDIFLL